MALVHGVKKHKLPKPIEIRRPYEERRKPTTDPRQIAQFLGRLRR